ncbi:MAG TPA: HNH endonuclease signature motif containing protein [Solirubrobacterales bacterium]|jgi:5-methylcytosine-specific restriction endonuclease McrA
MRQSNGNLSWATLSALITSGATCTNCGGREDLVAHHKIPRRYGGLDVLENLEPVCRSCHPAVEQEAIERAKLVWERPEWPDRPRRPRQRPVLRRPY